MSIEEQNFSQIETRIRAGNVLNLINDDRGTVHTMRWDGKIFIVQGIYIYPEHFATFEEGFLCLVGGDLSFDRVE